MILPIFACIFMCGEQIVVSVDARAGPQPLSRLRFEIAAGDPHVSASNPDFIAFSKAVTRALQADGFEAARSPGDSNLVVVIDWMTGEPKTYLRHMGGDVGGPQVSGAAPGGKGGMPAGGTHNDAAFGFGAEASDRGDLAWPQTFTIRALDKAALKADPAAAPLWQVSMTSESQAEQPGSAAFQMIAAAMPYMAKGAVKARTVLGSKEAPVKYVRGEIANLPGKGS